ncbi:MAG: LEA type 2 family protein [Halorientalis sp.]
MNVRSLLLGSTRRIVATAVVGLLLVGGAAVAAGILGAPSVVAVQNQFGPVNNSSTVIETDLVVNNPNPLGIRLGGTTVNYTVNMNDVAMASSQKEGLAVGTGNTTLNFTTRMDNSKIPPWWHSHVANGERTQVSVDARITSTLTAGRTVRVRQGRTVETDLIGQFDSEADRPVNANRPVVSDPVLWINSTSAAWDQAALTPERTPMNMSFTVYNPKPYPYAVTEVGYTITMNGVQVGTGSTDDVATLPPRRQRTIATRTVIDNSRLDEWWVTHLQNNQVTELEIQFYAVVDPVEQDGLLGRDAVGEFRIPLEPLDYQRTVETDIFGTKNDTASTGDGQGDGGGTRRPTPTERPERTDTPTETDTPTDDGLLGDGETTTQAGETTTEDPQTTSDSESTTDGGLLGAVPVGGFLVPV